MVRVRRRNRCRDAGGVGSQDVAVAHTVGTGGEDEVPGSAVNVVWIVWKKTPAMM
jgi:hypothetical protein